MSRIKSSTSSAVITEEEIYAGLANQISRLPKVYDERHGFVVGFNLAGTKPPIYWCFNSWAEPLVLKKYLGDDQPLYAMHSLAKILEDDQKPACRIILAENYYRTIENIHQSGPLLLGGNCQSVRIMELVADKMHTQDHIFVALEFQPLYDYAGRLLMLFGKQSTIYNPFLMQDSQPEEWTRKFPRASWGEIDGDHGQFFLSPSVDQLAQKLRQTVEVLTETRIWELGR